MNRLGDIQGFWVRPPVGPRTHGAAATQPTPTYSASVTMSASSISAEATVRKFLDRINAHDSQGVVALCTSDHIFVDSLGTELSGLSGLEQAWVGYFALFARGGKPDSDC